MTDTEQIRWDAYLCQPGEPPFRLGTIEAPDLNAAYHAAGDALAGFMPEASSSDLILTREGYGPPNPTPREVAIGPSLELPPAPLRRVELEQVSPHATRAVLMRFLSLALELGGKPSAGDVLQERLAALRSDLRVGELGALELCEDLAREANDLLSRSDRARREAMGGPPPPARMAAPAADEKVKSTRWLPPSERGELPEHYVLGTDRDPPERRPLPILMTDPEPDGRRPENYRAWLNLAVLHLSGRRRELQRALEVCDESDARTDIRRELTDTGRAVKALARLRRWT